MDQIDRFSTSQDTVYHLHEFPSLSLVGYGSELSILPDEPEYYRRELYEKYYYNEQHVSSSSPGYHHTSGIGLRVQGHVLSLNGERPGYPYHVAGDGGGMRDPVLGYSCGMTCAGNFIGVHQCLHEKRSLKILCLGHNDCQSTFQTRNNFNRHCRSFHPDIGSKGEKTRFSCSFKGCLRVDEKGFTRSDNLLQHRRKVHGEDLPKVKVRFVGANAGKFEDNSAAHEILGGIQRV